MYFSVFTVAPCSSIPLAQLSASTRLPDPSPQQPQVVLCSRLCFCFRVRFACVVSQILHISDITPYLSFSFSLSSLSVIISGCIHVATNGIIVSFLWLSSTPLYMFITLICQWTFRFPCLGYGEGNGTPLQTLAWRIPWTQEPGGLPSMGSHRVGHD